LFPFPEDQQRFFMWTDLLCKAGKSNEWNPNKESQICEVYATLVYSRPHGHSFIHSLLQFHFEPDQFNESGLIADALPSIFFPFAKKFNSRPKRKASLASQSSLQIEKNGPKSTVKEASSNDHFCRLCAKATKKSNVNLLEKTVKNGINLLDFLATAFDVSVREDDELPHTICMRCDQKLDDICRYRHECKMADEVLRRWKADGTVSIVKLELDDRFEFVCADEAAPKSVVDSVSIELREIKEEPEVTESEEFVKTVDGEVQKLEPDDEDRDAAPSGHSDFDDDDDVPLKPKTKKQDQWECPDCEEVLANRTKLREHRKICEMSKKKRTRAKTLMKREATRQKGNQQPSEADKQRMIDDILTNEDEDDTKLEKLLRPKSTSTRVWKCIDCEEILASRSKLKNHRSECKLIGTPLSKRRKRTDEAPIPCEHCGKMLTCKMGYKQHLTYCIGFDKGEQQAQALDKMPEKEAPDDGSETGVDNRVICHICGKKISQRSSMAAHIRFHEKIKPHQCKICSKSYYTAVSGGRRLVSSGLG
jgi:Zinc-finger associated domain (zf-AD)